MFRFTIRDLLWLMVVVGLACAVVVGNQDRKRLAKEVERAEWYADASLIMLDETIKSYPNQNEAPPDYMLREMQKAWERHKSKSLGASVPPDLKQQLNR